MEQLRDVYASQLVVTLAKQIGFNAEPSVINLANDDEFYTQSLMQKWLREVHKLCVYPRLWDPMDPKSTYVVTLCFIGSAREDELENCDTWEEALEAGLKEAFQILIECKKNGKLTLPPTS